MPRTVLNTPRRSLSVRRWIWLWIIIAGLTGTGSQFSIGDDAATTAAPPSSATLEADDGTASAAAPRDSETGHPDSATDHPVEGDHGGGGHGSGGHSDPVAPVLAGIVIILLLAKIGGDVFERFGMPAVLGELIVGVLLGNALFLTEWAVGIPGLEALHSLSGHLEFLKAPPETALGNPYSAGAVLKMLAGIGVILLLFEVGLESSVRDMVSVGASSLLVAILGVIAPAVLGYLCGHFIIPEAGWEVHAFLGATLCATSVGITARVLKDLGRSQQRESQIILGAAVIDDVLGLIVLAVVQGVIQKGSIEVGSLMEILAKSLGFLAIAIFLGTRVFARPLFKLASYLRGHGLLVAASLVICFGFAWLSNQIELAPIVGAFAAGLILERAHYRELGEKENVELEEALAPLTALLVPIFFVEMGIDVDLRSFRDPAVWGLAAALSIVAIIGKQICSLGVLEPGLNKLAVGLGMIPRGEVGLIFAKIGKDLRTHTGEPVISPQTYSAIVVMVMLTTMVTPPLLKWAMQREQSGDKGTPPAA
ncbi:MAG: cation:proton antiporter [Planctomycetaceae bacterium]